MAIHRHELPGGAWADLRDASEVSERLRRPVRAIQMKLAQNPAFKDVVKDAKDKGVQQMDDIDEGEAMKLAAAMGDEAFALMDDLNDRLILSRVAGWSFDFEVSLDTLQDLPGPAYDKLKEVCAEGALDNGPDFSPSQDTESPTAPSNVSA